MPYNTLMRNGGMRNGSVVTKPTVKKFAICSKNNQTWHKTVQKLPDFLLQRIKL